MQREWHALVINGTFLSVLDDHRPKMERLGLRIADATREVDAGATADWIRAQARNADVVFGPGPGLDAELFNDPGRLKVVAIAASGFDRVDIEAATRAGIVVTNAPTQMMSETVADLTWGLILSAARHIPRCHQILISERRMERTMGTTVWGKTLGVIGLGRIAMAVVRRARGFDMNVLAYNRTWDDARRAFASQHGVGRADFERVLAGSDFVSLHLRETDETRGMIGAAELARMKRTAYLINTARNGLVDQEALFAALREGRIAGAGLDTIADGGTDTPLIGLPNVVGTPHLGNRTHEAVYDYVDTAIDDAVAALSGKRPRFLVNAEVYHENHKH